MEFLQRTPFLRILLPFIVGVVIYQYFDLQHWSFFVLLSLSSLFILLSFLKFDSKHQYKNRWFFGCGVSLCIFLLAYFLTGRKESEKTFDHLGGIGLFRVELVSAPVEKLNSYMCQVQVLQYFDSTEWKVSKGRAIIYLQKDSAASQLLFGDRIILRTEFNAPERALNPKSFDYAAYLNRQGIIATGYTPTLNWKFTDSNASFSIRREADKCRKYLLGIYREFNIVGDEFAVLAALTLGYTDELQPDLRASYSATGAMHILSVSGMHVGVVYLVLAYLLSFLDASQRKKVYKTIIITLFLWFYAFLSGLSPSVVRAALMFSFVSVATCFERKSQIYNTLFMSAFFMLLYNPNFLFDVSFQLSYAAVLSIVFFQPIIGKLYAAKNKYSKFFWDLFSVSLAAQLGTVPFTLYYFHQFPNYFILTNLIAIPLSTIIIYLAIALFIVSIIPYLSVLIAFLLKWMLWLLNVIIAWIHQLPFSIYQISIDFNQAALILIAIFSFSAYWYSKKYFQLFLGMSSILLLGILNLNTIYHTLNSSKMIVYAGQKYTHVNFIDGCDNYAYTSDSTELIRIANAFWKSEKLDDPVFVENNSWFNNEVASFHGARVIILNNEFLKKQTYREPLMVDYLIIGNGLKPKINQVLTCLHPSKIIVDKSISDWYTNSIRHACSERNIAFYSLKEKGAYILNFID